MSKSSTVPEVISTETITEEIVEAPLETPIPTPDETSDWNIYNNATYGFSFKYPSDWILENPDPKTKDTYFKFQLKLGEVVIGDVLNNTTDITETSNKKTFSLPNNKILQVVYAQCIGPSCGSGSLDIPTFSKFFSTFTLKNNDVPPNDL
jgi:hypothetical protein